MALPTKHILSQGPVLTSLGGTALAALRQRLGWGAPSVAPSLPGPAVSATVAPLPPDLVRDYVRHVGGDPSAYRGAVPAHLFPQWGFPPAAKTLRGLPYPLAKVLNGGCRLEVRGELPAGQPLLVSARLEEIDDDGRRAVLHQRVVTGTAATPELVIGHLYAIVPLGGKPTDRSVGKRPERRPPARVPDDAEELAYWRIRDDAGLAFAMLTGDFNPVHWLPPYARAFGFQSPILHGFATMARAIEGLHRSLLADATRQIAAFDCRFTKPLALPARVGLYVKGGEVFVGDAPGGAAYLTGSLTLRQPD
jgi:acyl dehydratase